MDSRAGRARFLVILALCLMAWWMMGARGEAGIRLPRVFSDHAVLQRQTGVPIWGWSDAGETVTVTFAGQSKTATADAQGKWLVRLDAMPANAQPQELVVRGTT